MTDWLDGYLARRRKQVTDFGQWMDPLADKLLVTAALISLVQMELAPAWMVAVILGREFSVTVLRSIAHARGQTLPASPIGKVKMVAQVVAILVLILGRGRMQQFFIVGKIALWVATITALDLRRGLLAPHQRGAGAAGRAAARPGARDEPGARARSGQCLILIVAIRAFAF